MITVSHSLLLSVLVLVLGLTWTNLTPPPVSLTQADAALFLQLLQVMDQVHIRRRVQVLWGVLEGGEGWGQG